MNNGPSGRNIVYAVIYAACGIICLFRGIFNCPSDQPVIGVVQVVLAFIFLIVAVLYLRRR